MSQLMSIKRRRFRCPPCPAYNIRCLGLMKTETRKRITYECKIPLQGWEVKEDSHETTQ